MTITRSFYFRLLCFIMVICFAFHLSPIRAEAVALETLLVGGVFVVASILLGLGVMAGTQTDAWHNVVTNCVDALKSDTDWIDADGMIQLVQMSNGVRTSPGCPLDLIEWVRDWLFDNSVVQEVITNQIVAPQNYRCVYYQARNFDAVPTAVTSEYAFSDSIEFDGTITDTSFFFNTSNTRYHGGIFYSELFTLPEGEYQTATVNVNLYGLDSVLYGTKNYNFGLARVGSDGSVTSIFADDRGLTGGDSVVEFPYTTRTIMTKSDYQYCFYFAFIGQASRLDYPCGFEFESYPSLQFLGEPETEIIVEEGLAVGRVGKFDESISEGYTVWANSATVDGDLTYFPLGIAGDLNIVSGMTQEDVWSGVVYAAPPVVNNDDHIGILSYNKGDIPAAMAVHATSPDGGYLKYQWYLDAIPIDGATASVYYPRTDTVGESTYTCLISNYIDVTNDVTAAHVWSLPFVVTISDVAVPDVTTPDIGADTVGDTKLGTFIDAISIPIQDALSSVVDGIADLFVDSKTEAITQGNLAVNDTIAMIPDDSGAFITAFDCLVDVCSYEGTSAVITFPGISVPSVAGLFPAAVLVEPRDVDLEYFVQLMPQDIMAIIMALFDCAVVLYCLKEFFGLISGAVNGFNGILGEKEG